MHLRKRKDPAASRSQWLVGGRWASERGLSGFAPRGSEQGSSVDHSCLSAAPSWLFARTAGTRGRSLCGSHLPGQTAGSPLPWGQVPSDKARTSRSHPLVSFPKDGRRVRDRQMSASPAPCKYGHSGLWCYSAF